MVAARAAAAPGLARWGRHLTATALVEAGDRAWILAIRDGVLVSAEPAAAPVSLENGTVDEPGRWVVASEDVDGVFVFAKGDWYELGPMKAGDRRDPLTLKKRADNRLPGLPESIHDNCVRRKKPDWIIVALKKEMLPRGIPMWTNSLTKGRVIWVMQCP